MRLLPAVPLLALLAACSGPPDRIVSPPVTTEGSVRIGYASVEVRDISLPAYSQTDEVFVQGPDGLVRPESGLRWADDPIRAATLDLVRSLGSLTGARIASEPWPFDDYPDARVEVRVEEFLPSIATASFRVTGQVFVADLTGTGRDRSGRFDIAVPLAEGFGAAEIAAARATAMAELAVTIAETVLR